MSAPLFDREFLRVLEQVTLLCRDDLAGVLGTDHRARTHGAGLEFSDYRHYSAGDDPRFLDWNAYLRLGKLLLKVYRTEQRIPIRVLLDCSQSMNCEPGAASKFDYARRLAATLGYLALRRLDSAAVVPFAARMRRPFVISGGRDRFWPLLEFLEGQEAGGTTDLFGVTHQFLGTFHARGALFVISDFLDDDASERSLKMLRAAGHDVVLIHVHTPEERRPTAVGDLVLEDAETGELRRVEASPESAALYERSFADFCERLRRAAVRHGGRYARAVTDVPYQEFVLRSLRHGRVLA